MAMKIGAPKEAHAGEQRVALTPDSAERLHKLGYQTVVESGAGEGAHISDEAYREAGVEVVADARALWTAADIVVKVRPPEPHPVHGVHEAELMREGGTLRRGA